MSRRQNSLTLAVKQAILNEVSEGAMRKSEIAAKYGIAKSTLSTILKSREKIEAAYSCSQFKPARKRLRPAKNKEIETALLKWICEAHCENLPITGKILQEKAKSFSEIFGATDFMCSNGWLQRFKQRHGIVFKKEYDEGISIDSETDSFFAEWPTLIKKYARRDIFYVNETILCYKAHPSCTLMTNCIKCSDNDCSKESLAVLVTCSIDGNKKLPLVAVGKSPNPQCLKFLKTLPVCYTSSKNACMTTGILSKWLKGLDKDFAQEKQKVCFIIGACNARCEVSNLQSIKCIFLSSDQATWMRPCVQGMIRCLKLHYRIELLRKTIQCFDDGSLFSLNLLDALIYLRSAWKFVSPQTVRNCFRKGGFINSELVETVSEPEPEMLTDLVEEAQIRGIITVEKFKEYICMDDDMQASEVVTEDEILATGALEQKEENAKAPQENDKVDLESSESMVSLNKASEALRTLRQYLMEQNDSSHLFDNLDNVQEFWKKCSLLKMKENSIANFFR